jgi:hypothetical protein
MRFITTTLSATIIVLAATSPILARTADATRPTTEISPSPCHAYEQNPDGSWKEIGCVEDGLKPPAPAQISTRNAGKAGR